MYSYDPTQITKGGKDQMRFVLQDTLVDGGAETCALSDEEYAAIIEENTRAGLSFRHARRKCLGAIVMKFAYEVDFSADGLSISLGQRYARWKKLWDEAMAEEQRITANPAALGKTALDGGHYFYAGMMDNPRAEYPAGPFREVF